MVKTILTLAFISLSVHISYSFYKLLQNKVDHMISGSTKKKSKTLPIIAVVVIAVAGAGYYYMQNKNAEPVTANEIAAAPANVETAAGEAQPKADAPATTPKIIAKEGEIIVKAGNPVVAKVDGKDITRVDVYRFIQTMPANMQQLPATTVYPLAMEQVINTRLVQNLANEADIIESDKFKAEMAVAKQQIARNLFLQDQVDKKITDGKIKKAYNDFIKKQPDVEERHARHILLKTEDKAKAVIKQLQAGGDFAGVAKDLSVGPTAAKGGDLGYFAKAEMVPEFSEAAFGLKKGDVLEAPVKTQFGWHVIKVEDIRQRAKPTLEQVKPAIQAELRREILEDLLKNWRKGAKIEQFDINGEALKKGANATGLVPPKAAAK
jgi:peptidyl-prolyl cis-trans isomerase C